MATARQLPPNKPAAGPLADRVARWPVLARIAEVRREDEAPARAAASTEPTYRLDAPHLDVPAPPVVAPALQAKSPASPLQRSGEHPQPTKVAPAQISSTPDETDPTSSLPIPIRAAVDAWQIVQPHHELIRFAAMLALMVAAGMSAVLMMRGRLQPGADTSSPVAATSSQPGDGEPAVQHAEFEPALELQLTPESDTSSLEPTSTGPLSPPAKPVMAVETEASPAAPPYPTTSLAEVTLPPLDEIALPKVQTKDPEIARLRGDVIETTVR